MGDEPLSAPVSVDIDFDAIFLFQGYDPSLFSFPHPLPQPCSP